MSDWTAEKIAELNSEWGDHRGLAGRVVRSALDEIERLQARVVKLSERLEITHVYQRGDGDDHLRRVELDEPLPEHMDGISCRNETIRLQDEQLDKARERDQRRGQLLRTAYALMDGIDVAGWDAAFAAQWIKARDRIQAELGDE